MLQKFDSLNNIGIFSNFKWPEKLPHFNRFNLIYGWNGSGKTTLSRFLRYLENNDFLPQDWKPEFEVTTTDAKLNHNTADKISNTLCVFNVDFINENIEWEKGSTKKLLIGKANKELSEKLKNEKQVLKLKTLSSGEYKEQAAKGEKDKDTFLSKRAKEIKDRLSSYRTDKYRNYNKADFLKTISILQKESKINYSLNDEQEKKFNADIHQQIKNSIDTTYPSQEINSQLISSAISILSQSPASSFIEVLKKDPELNAWVRRGYQIHTDKKEKQCQFCLQSIPAERLISLEKHFSEEYASFISEIDRIGMSIKSYIEKYSNIELVRSADLDIEFQEEYKSPQQNFYQHKERWKEIINEILSSLRSKRENPFSQIECAFCTQVLEIDTEIIKTLKNINLIIEKHNQKSKNIDTHIDEAKKALEYSMVFNLLDEYHVKERFILETNQKINFLDKEIVEIQKEIEKTEAMTIDTKIAENIINKNLHLFLGRDDLKIKDAEEGYSILRNNKVAKYLSEGEKTAIALIYFLSKINEGDKKLSEKIIVIDDPVSSLDNQSLHFALAFIKENILSAKQVFFLTHNFYCMKEVKRWRDRKGYKKEEFVCYMTEASIPSENVGRSSSLSELPSLLEKYDSEYHYLFSEIYKSHLTTNENSSLHQLYPLGNMARKVLETFLSFKVPSGATNEARIKELKGLEDSEKMKLIWFLDFMSHADNPDRTIEFPPSSVEQIKSMISLLMKLIEKNDSVHFAGMKSVYDAHTKKEDAKTAVAA